jgi:chorismate mutase/prephenate dehydratase
METSMADRGRNLDELRQEIDDIDTSIHDALIARVSLVDEIASAKRREGSNEGMMRPAREARILRALLDRHEGNLPRDALLRIWREMINALTALQGPFEVAVCAPERSVGYWDLARNQFGSSTKMSLHKSPAVVLRLVDENPGTIGLLPTPQEGEAEPWWPGLISGSAEGDGPRIVWRLPFYNSPASRFESIEAVALARMLPEPSGDDITLAVLETGQELSRARVVESLKDAGIAAEFGAVHTDRASQAPLYLLEIQGFLTAEDERLQVLETNLGDALDRIAVLGAYPRPYA